MDERQAQIEAIGNQLRAKILSKVQTTTFLGGLTVAGLAAQMSNPGVSARPPLFAVSVGLMLGAVVLYVAGLIKLDELTMPKRFWEEDPHQEAGDYMFVLLTDDDLWVIRNRMVFYWNRLTLTATAAAGLALFLLLIPSTWIAPAAGPDGNFVVALSVLALAGGYLATLLAVARKRLGVLGRPAPH